MKFYLDFEANAVTQEIISIGAVSENGRTFYSLVRPHTKLDRKIKELTGISQESAEVAPSIEEVMGEFFLWVSLSNGGHWGNPTFYVYGSHDKTFIDGSLAFVEDETTCERLKEMRRHLDNVAGRVSRKFGRSSIGLRSAYLTMRLAFDESATQDHNALNDAAMLKWVWERIDGYELPEGITPIKVEKPNMCYGKKKSKPLTLDGRLYDYPMEDSRYKVNFKVIGKNCRGIEKEWHFNYIGAAITLVYRKKIRSNQQKIIIMDRILNAIETGEKLEGKFFIAE